MKFILEYAEYGGVSLPNGITITNSERMIINKIIRNAIESFYSINRYSNDFIINGKVIKPEYLFKAVNNITLLRKIVLDPSKEIISNINNKEELFNFIETRLYDLFHYDGLYFDSVYNLLVNTSKKGKRLEEIAFKEFEEMAKKRKMDIVIDSPSIREDINGIDGIFTYNNKKYTIQVKPLVNVKDCTDSYEVKCDGALKNLITDYLITINEKEIWIFRSKGITVFSSHYLIPKNNLVQ